MQQLRRVTANGRRAAWALKLDVASFFPSNDKEMLDAILARQIRDSELRWLTRVVLFQDPTASYRFRSRRRGVAPPGTPGYPVVAAKSLFGKGNARERARPPDRQLDEPVLGERVSQRARPVREAAPRLPQLYPLRRRPGPARQRPRGARAGAGRDRGVPARASRAGSRGATRRARARRGRRWRSCARPASGRGPAAGGGRSRCWCRVECPVRMSPEHDRADERRSPPGGLSSRARPVLRLPRCRCEGVEHGLA